MSYIGATLRDGEHCRFTVWAPRVSQLQLHVTAPADRYLQMEAKDRGYWEITAPDVGAGSRYLYRLEGVKEFPDPASRFQPDGVHGPSEVVDPTFEWHDGQWHGLPLSSYLFYEVHIGTYSPEGTFDGAIGYLDRLAELGVTAVEVMPIGQFPGKRDWGYDGVYPFAVQNSYGGPLGLKRLVDACHRRGLAVVLDVVYNHLGPEGNYSQEYGYYLTERYRTPWGPAVNLDGPYSDEVRRFLIDNALYWVDEFHFDALRLDAVHALYDQSAQPFLQELAEAVHRRGEELGRSIYLIAESDLNDIRLVLPPQLNGYGLDAQWSDDLHHALHALVTRERTGYYQDFGPVQKLVLALTQGYTYTGQYSSFRRRRHGNSPRLAQGNQFVVCAQNHDQIGNRPCGDRLSTRVPLPALQLSAALILLSPFLPLLFMGEEYGETAPFPFFTDYQDPALAEAVREGRAAEFASIEGPVPDPQDQETMKSACLHHELIEQGWHRTLYGFYQELIGLRRRLPALAALDKDAVEVSVIEPAPPLPQEGGIARVREGGSRQGMPEPVLLVRRWSREQQACLILNAGPAATTVELPMPVGRWRREFDSAEPRWQGGGREAYSWELFEETAPQTFSRQANQEPGPFQPWEAYSQEERTRPPAEAAFAWEFFLNEGTPAGHEPPEEPGGEAAPAREYESKKGWRESSARLVGTPADELVSPGTVTLALLPWQAILYVQEE